MAKIDNDFIVGQYTSGVENYTEATKTVGLWAAERYVLQKYLRTTDRILDLGCGTGRTTYALYQSGYKDIIGVDLTPAMIHAAQALGGHFQAKLDFRVGNATALEFPSACFDAVLFSFNGIMSIPGAARRQEALQEVWRVLRPGGHFIFTTHDRDKDENYRDFWAEQRSQWDAGKRDNRVYEFGDIITTSKNEERNIYIHIPSRAEVWQSLSRQGFKVQETFYRSDRFQEDEEVRRVSGECRFWVAQKR